MSEPLTPVPELPASSAEPALRAPLMLPAAGSESLFAGTHVFDLMGAASRYCRRLVDAERARVWVARRGGRRLIARESRERQEGATELRAGQGEGLAGWVIEHEKSLRIGPGDAPLELRGERPTFRSAIVLPLFRRGEAFGAIECLDKRGGGAFDDADFDQMELASEQVAFALDNSLLYEETEKRALEREVLLEVAKALSEAVEVEDVLAEILRALREVVSYDAVAIYLVNRRTLALEMQATIGYPEGSEGAFSLQVGQGIVGWVAKTGQPVIVPDVTRDPRYVAARPSTRSELAAPLQLKGRTIGVFNLENDREDAYHEGHLELLGAFAAQAAVALERARLTRELLERRRLEKELAIAREIQLSFLPKRAPDVPGFELAGAALPHDEVGGDYYDYINVGEHRLGLAIADVSGKGIPAALIMAGFRMSLLAEIRNEFAIRAIMHKVNSLLHESTDRGKFVTAFYGVLDWRTGTMTFCNAGHNPPILRHADGRIDTLSDGGVALGVLPDARYDDRPIAIRPGDVLLMYTDGVSEAESPSGEQYGRTRIEQELQRLADRSAQAIVDGLIASVLEWTAERGQNDDLTLMVVKSRPETADLTLRP